MPVIGNESVYSWPAPSFTWLQAVQSRHISGKQLFCPRMVAVILPARRALPDPVFFPCCLCVQKFRLDITAVGCRPGLQIIFKRLDSGIEDMTITQHKVVSIHYKVADAANAEVIDSSEGGEPMTYLHGARNIIPGLEQALEGKSQGDALEVTIPPAEAYGERSDDRVQQVPREAFEGMDKIEPGMAVSAQTGQGQIDLVVTAVDD